MLGHATADVLARERLRVGVANDDEDAGEARAGVGLRAALEHVLDSPQRALVAQPQRLGLPRVGVARAELAEQRRELPAERERDADDDELERARCAARAGRREDVVVTLAVQDAIERRALPGIRGRREHVRDGTPSELLGGPAEHRDDADAALGDHAVGRAEDVVAIGQGEQRLLDEGIGRCGRG